MKCKACREFDKKVEEMIEEFEVTDPALEYRHHDLIIDRDMDCTCSETEKAANETVHFYSPTIANPSKKQAEERASRPMSIDSKILKIVKDKKVEFSFYRAGNLYYKTECGIEFPVPIADAGEATFLKEDKAILFMRYIRKHLVQIEEEGKCS